MRLELLRRGDKSLPPIIRLLMNFIKKKIASKIDEQSKIKPREKMIEERTLSNKAKSNRLL